MNRNYNFNNEHTDAQRYIRDSICPLSGRHFNPTECYDGASEKYVKAIYILDLVNHYLDVNDSWVKRYRRGEGDYHKRIWAQGIREEGRLAEERAKRQIIRKATDILISLGINSEVFKLFHNIDQMTINLAIEKLDNKTIVYQPDIDD